MLTDLGRYAGALYVSALSKGDKTLSKVESDLKSFDSILKDTKSQDAVKLRTFLANPTLSVNDKEKVISELLNVAKGGADEIHPTVS